MATTANAVVFVQLHGGATATIDLADWSRPFVYQHHGVDYTFRICDLSWHSDAGGKKTRKRYTTYARSSVRRDGVKFSFRMHTLILGKRDGCDIDHVDGNGLNNTRANLEHVPHAENIRRGHVASAARAHHKEFAVTNFPHS